MTAYSLLVCVVPHNSGEYITEKAAAAGSGGGTILMGRGTASSTILQMLGLGDTSKDIAYILVPHDRKHQIMNAIATASSSKRQHFGILFAMDAFKLIKAGKITGGDDSMAAENRHQLITIIVNRGFADDVMAAARKAGAGGGTIVNARGTAKEGDAKFFGMQIVPEKEMLMILADNDKASSIIDAVKTLKCLTEPGCGIAFCTGADSFTPLGRQHN